MQTVTALKRVIAHSRHIQHRSLANYTPQSLRELGDGLSSGRRDCLARAITLIESTRKDHKEQSVELLDYLAKLNAEKKSNSSKFAHGKTIRIGIAGKFLIMEFDS